MIFSLAAAASWLLPLATIVPGLALVKRWTIGNVVLAVLLGLSMGVVGTYFLALLNISVVWYLLIAIIVTITGVWMNWRGEGTGKILKPVIITGIIFIAVYSVLGLLFCDYQQALPTGDSQKAIFWAQRVNGLQSLPDYQISVAQLNRDPVDFFTPGLHTLVALYDKLSANIYWTTGFFALALASVLLLLTAVLAIALFPSGGILVAVLSSLFVLSNIRFWRYVGEPGYHLQNLLGEVLLFGFIYSLVVLTRRWNWLAAGVSVATVIALTVSHQFSAFIAAFVALPVAVSLVYGRFSALNRSRPYLIMVTVIAVVAGALLGVSLDLHTKIPHIFTWQPHLLSFTPSLWNYFRIMGLVWMSLVAGGLGLLVAQLLRHRSKTNIVFLLTLLIIIALSQGPRLGVDIPPVRALFYLVVPGSIAAAYFVTSVWRALQSNRMTARWFVMGVVVIYLSFSLLPPVTRAAYPSHAVRTNSTLTPSFVSLIEFLKQQPESLAVITDDYNRRSTSWLLLSGKPLFSRTATDVAQTMEEAKQSELRRQLYIKQLDFEKIYSLGSQPLITSLLAKHNANWVTGIRGSSEKAFRANPALRVAYEAEDATLFSVNQDYVVDGIDASISTWLLKTGTLANDIGDDEDTYEHLPASIRSPRLSEPVTSSGSTYRSTTSPLIPLHFNIGQYVANLWGVKDNVITGGSLDLLLLCKSDANNLSLTTPDGGTVPFSCDGTKIRIDPSAALLNQKGFITIIINNPNERAVDIDLVALGLASVP